MNSELAFFCLLLFLSCGGCPLLAVIIGKLTKKI